MLRFPIADVLGARHSEGMEHASLVAFLSGTLSPEALANEIVAEVATCNAAFEAGQNGFIVITDGPRFEVTKAGARRPLAAVADESLPFELANYVADCIIMSDDFDFADDTVKEAVYFVEDDSRPPTSDETRKILGMLG
jgi:hypothetical protein